MTFDELHLFKNWLEVRDDVEILPATNPYEKLRFQGPSGTGIVYTNARGQLSYTNPPAQAMFKSFCAREPTIRRANLSHFRAKLAARDPHNCLYCRRPIDPSDSADSRVEYILPRSLKGPNTLDNCALACALCDEALGASPPAAKIRFAQRAILSREIIAKTLFIAEEYHRAAGKPVLWETWHEPTKQQFRAIADRIVHQLWLGQLPDEMEGA